MDEKPYQIFKGIEDILITSFFELENLISLGKEYKDFLPPSDEYDIETGELIDNEFESPLSFKFFMYFYDLVSNIDFLIDEIEDKKIKEFFNMVKKRRSSMSEKQFLDKFFRYSLTLRKMINEKENK